MQEMNLISGIGDFCQIYVKYKVEPQRKLINFQFRIINMTSFMIENLVIQTQVSENLEVMENLS